MSIAKPISTYAYGIVLALLGCLVCVPSTTADVDERIENAAQGIALTALPAGFTLRNNLELGISLERPDEPHALLRILTGPVQHGEIDLETPLSRHKTQLHGREGVRHTGERRIEGPNGPIQISTAELESDLGLGTFAEIDLFTAVPTGDRLLGLSYRYLIGDEDELEARLGQMLAVLEKIESLE